jgi:protein-tyrosine phosphatase
MDLTFLPLGLPGNIFRSPMPFGQFDHTGLLYQAFWKNDIQTVVVLVPDAECWVCSGQDLRKRYERDGLGVIHLPMKDYRGIDIPTLTEAVDEVLGLARNGINIDIHCHAGLGRTGLFAACLARRQLGMTGREAIRWIRGLVPGSVESDEQERVIKAFPANQVNVETLE